jgi:hypothetical protein
MKTRTQNQRKPKPTVNKKTQSSNAIFSYFKNLDKKTQAEKALEQEPIFPVSPPKPKPKFSTSLLAITLSPDQQLEKQRERNRARKKKRKEKEKEKQGQELKKEKNKEDKEDKRKGGRISLAVTYKSNLTPEICKTHYEAALTTTLSYQLNYKMIQSEMKTYFKNISKQVQKCNLAVNNPDTTAQRAFLHFTDLLWFWNAFIPLYSSLMLYMVATLPLSSEIEQPPQVQNEIIHLFHRISCVQLLPTLDLQNKCLSHETVVQRCKVDSVFDQVNIDLVRYNRSNFPNYSSKKFWDDLQIPEKFPFMIKEIRYVADLVKTAFSIAQEKGAQYKTIHSLKTYIESIKLYYKFSKAVSDVCSSMLKWNETSSEANFSFLDYRKTLQEDIQQLLVSPTTKQPKRIISITEKLHQQNKERFIKWVERQSVLDILSSIFRIHFHKTLGQFAYFVPGKTDLLKVTREIYSNLFLTSSKKDFRKKTTKHILGCECNACQVWRNFNLVV